MGDPGMGEEGMGQTEPVGSGKYGANLVWEEVGMEEHEDSGTEEL